VTVESFGVAPAAPLRIRSRVRDYQVDFDDSDGWARSLAALDGTFVVVDENVLRLHGDGVLAPFRSGPIAVMPASEDRKTFEMVAELCVQAIERSAKRGVVLVSIGGGITQDVTISPVYISNVLQIGQTRDAIEAALRGAARGLHRGRRHL